MKTKNIERRRLGEQVFDVLAELILDGTYPPEMHLSEINICSEMKVSRTPVREALFKLEEKGLVVSHPNRGFFVPPLSKQVVEDNYPILAALDALALGSSEVFPNKTIIELKQLNERIRAAKNDPMKLYQLDLDFHDCLIKNCPNERLLGLIEDLKFETRQRDGGYRRGMAGKDLAYNEHLEIISLLEAGNNKKAATALEKHWLNGIKTVTDWIDRKKEEKSHEHEKSA